MKLKAAFLALFLTFVSIPVFATDHVVADCEEGTIDSKEAEAGVVADDRIIVPAGTCTWTTAVTFTKRITLVGNGIGSTVITMSLSSALNLGTSDASVTGFSFTNGGSNIGTFIAAHGDGGQGKIYGNEFTNTFTDNQRCIYHDGASNPTDQHPSYLVYSNTFNDCRVSVAGDTSTAFGNQNWANPLNFGNNHTGCIIIEDNVFDYASYIGNAIETDYGGCAVVRFNSFSNAEIHQHGSGVGVTEHPPGRVIEAYANKILSTDGNPGIWFRSGTGVIWGNHIATAASQDMRFDMQGRTPAVSCGTPSSVCIDGLQPEDGNLGSGSGAYPRAGWPGAFQPGFGEFINDWVEDTFTGLVSWPIGIWWNRTCANPSAGCTIATDPQAVMTFQDSFDSWFANGFDYNNEGSSVMGIGTSLPGTCNHNRMSAYSVTGSGDYYFKTDEGSWNAGSNNSYTGQGVLYKCTSANTWTVYYTPREYPDPRRDATPSGTRPPFLIRPGD
jgi:hypothetical protein